MCGLVEEALTAGCAVRLPLSVLSISADDVKQLMTHLVPALTELHCYYGHVPARSQREELPGGSIVFRSEYRIIQSAVINEFTP